MYLTGIGSPTGDASSILEDSFHTPDPEHEYGGNNFGSFSDPELDKRIEDSASILDVEKRRTIIQSIMVSLMEQLPWVPLYTDQDAYGIDRRLEWTPRNDSYIFAFEIHRKQ